MDLLTIGLIILFIIIIIWIFSGKKNKSIDPDNMKMHTITNKKLINPMVEYIDIEPLFDSCGKDITHSARLLKDLYGDDVNSKVVVFNKNDDMLYANKWTSTNVCKNITESDIVKYGTKEANMLKR